MLNASRGPLAVIGRSVYAARSAARTVAPFSSAPRAVPCEAARDTAWNYPTPIRFGAGRVAELPAACAELGISRPLLVTDPGVLSVGTMVRDAAASLSDCPIYSDVQGNPTEANVMGGVAAYREHGCDGVVAFGGGSAMDAAKCVALMVGQTRPLFDFEDREDYSTRVDEAGMAPCVAGPTTSGTGSEVGRASVITDESDHTKKIIFHAKMLPERVILDPALTLGLPKHITAWVGIDALSHSMEAFASPLYHPMAHGMALEGMRLVKDYLPRLMEDGADLEARSQLMVASTVGATAFQKGLGAMHSLTHPAGGLLNTQHGQTISVCMPYVLQFNRPAVEESFEALARYLDLEDRSVNGVTDWVLALRETCGIPHTLADLGIEEDHVETLAPMAAVDPSSGSNPVPVTVESATGLYLKAIRGTL